MSGGDECFFLPAIGPIKLFLIGRLRLRHLRICLKEVICMGYYAKSSAPGKEGI
jgi:hypothetical protein